MDEPIWEPDPPGTLWTYTGPHGFMTRKAVRNGVLWAAKAEVRERNILKAIAWREAAVADGWDISPTYEGHEDVSRAWRLSREGFSVQGLTRPASDKTLPEASIHIWGPDALQVRPPPIYDWAAIVAGMRICSACGAKDVDTQRYSFAGRCCAPCRLEMARLHERPGWTE